MYLKMVFGLEKSSEILEKGMICYSEYNFENGLSIQ